MTTEEFNKLSNYEKCAWISRCPQEPVISTYYYCGSKYETSAKFYIYSRSGNKTRLYGDEIGFSGGDSYTRKHFVIYLDVVNLVVYADTSDLVIMAE